MTDPMQPTDPAAPEPAAPEPVAPEPAAPPMAPEPMAPAAPAAAAPAAPVGWAAPAPAVATAGTGARPTGLTIAAILASIYGGLLVLAALLLILGSSLLGGAAGASGEQNAGAVGGLIAGVGIVAAIIVLLFALAYIFTAVGNWRGRSWSWTLGVVVWAITLIFGVLGLTGGINAFNLVLQIVFPIIALYFLWQPDVKRALGRG